MRGSWLGVEVPSIIHQRAESGVSAYNSGSRTRWMPSMQHPAGGMSQRFICYSEDCARRFRQNACRDDNFSLDSLIAMAICLDNLLRERWHCHHFSASLSEHFGSEPDPMEVWVTCDADGDSWGSVSFVFEEGSSSGIRYVLTPREQRDGHMIFHLLGQV